MPLSVGDKLGPYEILALIGAGGMGEVYRARDARLNRDVAIKISQERFSDRFEREARAVAALNHPNICTLYDIGPNYLVMEYIEGKALRELIPHRGMALVQVLNYAAQIADGLAAAHAAGIVHRDLKPGNIMVTAVGRVKVVDFGLARVAMPAAHSPDDPTFTLTVAGEIAGTVSYMSPEQAQGQSVDARSDTFSFGAVLYEMLTGIRAFRGDSAMSTLAEIINKDPQPAGEIASDLPREVETLLGRCLRKDPARRWQDMADVKVALLDLKEDSESGREHRAPQLPKIGKRPWAKIAAWVLPAVAGIVAGALWDQWRLPRQEVWSGTLLGGPIIASHPRISPDGQLLAFRAIVDGLSQVAVMKPDAASWTVLTRDQNHGAMHLAAWARDGSKIYFDREAPTSVYSIAPLGGEPRLVLENAAAPEPLPDGSLIVLRPSADGRLQLFHFWPDTGHLQPLPAEVTPGDPRTVCAFPDGKEVAVLGYDGSRAGSQHLFVLDLVSGTALDLPGPENFGAATEVGGGSSRHPQTVAVSADGRNVLTLVNRDDTILLAALPRDGSKGGRILMSFPVGAAPLAFDVAPDGSIYADQSSFDASVLTIGAAGKITSETRVPKDAYAVVPLPSGGFVFTLERGGRSQLLAAAPATEPRPLFNTNENVRFPGAWLANGRLVFVIGQGDQARLAIGSVADGRILQRFPSNAQRVTAIAASPDGHTIYYASDGAIWAQPAAGGAAERIGEGYDVMADPLGKSLYAMRAGADGYELWRMPAKGGEAQKIDVPPGYKLAPGRHSPMAVNADGRILLAVNTPQVFYYQAAILNPKRHTMSVVPVPPQTIASNAGWAADGTIQLMATRWSSTLWRYRLLPADGTSWLFHR